MAKVNVANLIKLLAVLRARIPGRHLPQLGNTRVIDISLNLSISLLRLHFLNPLHKIDVSTCFN